MEELLRPMMIKMMTWVAQTPCSRRATGHNWNEQKKEQQLEVYHIDVHNAIFIH